jgi:hypothetical protein
VADLEGIDYLPPVMMDDDQMNALLAAYEFL